MTYTCIGKRKGERGTVISCTNTSETPSIADKPQFGWLCPLCLGTQYGRPTPALDLPDNDHPNAPELEAYETEPGSKGWTQETEAEELADLRDLELDINGTIW
jgi:hypothetical protein